MMTDNMIQLGQPQAHYNVSETRILKYSVEMYHKGLNEHKLISAPEIDILQNKVDLQVNKWNQKWETHETKRKAQEEREANQKEAENRTLEAQAVLKQLDDILTNTLSVDDTVEWESLKKHDKFPMPKPEKSPKQEHIKIPDKPDKNSEEFVPKFTLLEKILKSKKEKKIAEYDLKYSNAVEDWEKTKQKVEDKNKKIDVKNEKALQNWELKLKEWEEEETRYYQAQEEYNKKIDQLKEAYLEKDVNSITEYCEIVLNNSKYPDFFSKDFEIEYNPENEILVIEYQFPSPDDFPRVKEVKYIASQKTLKETLISETELKKNYDEAMYKITLRTLHEIFEADTVNAIKAISFNGWVSAVNKATGKDETNCILSIQANKEEFTQIELANVDPKICFKNLKGVASSKLSTLTPIQPILQISKLDKRFVDGYDVAHTIDEATNIAAMDWEDFEHLIRELFEKEFRKEGGEVKVTQASRDGGVDAIAFDPDPIRGGKIVIQAKRYTNVVGVAAVRDLYGTVVNEGATKGILVTTADYGHDAYDFAKDKPITLLNGSNLLHLLGKHGHHAKIDLKEAKKILAEKED